MGIYQGIIIPEFSAFGWLQEAVNVNGWWEAVKPGAEVPTQDRAPPRLLPWSNMPVDQAVALISCGRHVAGHAARSKFRACGEDFWWLKWTGVSVFRSCGELNTFRGQNSDIQEN